MENLNRLNQLIGLLKYLILPRELFVFVAENSR